MGYMAMATTTKVTSAAQIQSLPLVRQPPRIPAPMPVMRIPTRKKYIVLR